MAVPNGFHTLCRMLLFVAMTSVGCVQEDCDNPFRPSPPAETYAPTPGAAPVSIVSNATFIAGDRRSFHCAVEDPRWGQPLGVTVPLGVDNAMGFTGQTRPGPAIYLNFTKLNSMPVGAQVFLFAHECGHVNSGDPLNEVAANCWGARIIAAQNALTEAQWDDVRKVLVASYPSATDPYPSGAEQWRMMQGCR